MVSKALDEAIEEIADLKDLIEYVSAVEVDGAHIPVEWRDVGGIRIGLDACGNAVRVEFPDRSDGWCAE